MNHELILILGGARAGKSAFAQLLAREYERVLVVATAEPGDDDMRDRIAAHRAVRPPEWDTLEEPVDLAGSMEGVPGHHDAVLIDCLTLWVSNLVLRENNGASLVARGGTEQGLGGGVEERARALLEHFERSRATWIVVSNEVGLGVVPGTGQGRLFRDRLGRVNQLFAARADRVYLMVAGLVVELKEIGGRPV